MFASFHRHPDMIWSAFSFLFELLNFRPWSRTENNNGSARENLVLLYDNQLSSRWKSAHVHYWDNVSLIAQQISFDLQDTSTRYILVYVTIHAIMNIQSTVPLQSQLKLIYSCSYTLNMSSTCLQFSVVCQKLACRE